MKKISTIITNLIIILASLLLVARDSLPPADRLEQARAYTRSIEFDFTEWTLKALLLKQEQAALDLPRYIPPQRQKELVAGCLERIAEIRQVNLEIESIYADPLIVDKTAQAAPAEKQLAEKTTLQEQQAPLCESILQQQLNAVLATMGFTLGGQTIPPVLYHATPLPYALIVSPRSIIRQDANISLRTDLALPEMVTLEEKVEKGLDVSALVVPVGGIGVYPTMVLNTPYLPSLVEVVAHEWIHNYLSLRPLGMSYDVNAELRTMNETTASIAESEIAQVVLSRYYPEYLPPPSPPPTAQNSRQSSSPPTTPVFDFNTEMHQTRVTADLLLEEGRIEEAEQYMEERRQFLWQHGYQIRRLNQAYFAFYGAYAAQPGGSAGADPVGPAVRALRAQSPTLVDFVNRISWMTSFETLKQTVGH